MVYLKNITVTGFPVRSAFRSLLSFFEGVFEMGVTIREFQHLSALSDTDLAKIGLARKDLSAYIFRNFK